MVRPKRQKQLQAVVVVLGGKRAGVMAERVVGVVVELVGVVVEQSGVVAEAGEDLAIYGKPAIALSEMLASLITFRRTHPSRNEIGEERI